MTVARLVIEGEKLDGCVLLSAHGDRRYRVRAATRRSSRAYSLKDAVYELIPLGGDYGRGGGVRALVRSEHQLIVRGWIVASGQGAA